MNWKKKYINNMYTFMVDMNRNLVKGVIVICMYANIILIGRE